MKLNRFFLLVLFLSLISVSVFARYENIPIYQFQSPFPDLNSSLSYIYINGTNSYANYLYFNTTYVPTGSELPGTTYYDNSSHTLSTVLENGVILQNGQEFHIYGKNTGGVDIHNGDAVSIITNNGQFTAFGLTNASNPISAYAFIGLATQDIPINSFGYVTSRGVVHEVNTANYTEGRSLYVDVNNTGHLTQTFPTAPAFVITVGIVEYSHAIQGRINVIPLIVPRLEDLSDVDGYPLNTTGQFYVWNQTRQVFDSNFNINDYVKNSSLNISNYVPYTGSDKNVSLGAYNFSVDTSALFVDANANRVGINTATPAVPFHTVLAGGAGTLPSLGSQIGLFQNNNVDSANSIFALLSGNGTGGVGIGGATGIAGIQFGDTQAINRGLLYYYHANDSMYLGTAGSFTSGMTITSAGNVGLGTTSPTRTLEVNGTFSVKNTTGFQGLYQTTTGNVGIGLTTPTQVLDVLGGIQGNNLLFQTATSGATSIDTINAMKSVLPPMFGSYADQIQGKPITLLEYDTNGTGNWSTQTSSLGQVLLDGTQQTSLIIPSATAKGFRITINAGAYKAPSMIVIEQGWTNPTGSAPLRVIVDTSPDLVSWTTQKVFNTTGSSSGSLDHYATLTSAGHTASAYWRYTIVRTDLANSNTLHIFNIKLLSSTNMNFGVYKGIPINWDYNGSIGIGTTTPSAKLDVNGTFSVKNTTGFQGLYQTTTGNVGIGTTSPTQKLDVNGSINQTSGNSTINLIYGEMYGKNETGFVTVDLINPDVYYQITNFTGGLLNGFTVSNSNLTASVSGIYKIEFSTSVSDGASGEHGFKLFVNEVGKDNCYSHLHDNTLAQNTGFSCLVSLSASDKVSVRIDDHASPVNDIIIYSANLNAVRVGN